MWIWNWFVSEVPKLLALGFVAIPGALVGAIIKGIFDRKLIRTLKSDREDAQKDRESANRSRQRALKETTKAVEQLAKRDLQLEQREKVLDELQRKFNAERAKLDHLLERLRSNETGLWATYPPQPPFDDFNARIGRRKPVILTVANNKGGVGKTTLVGNLLAYFEKNRRKRVLAIDMDYQGSLSTMLQGQLDAVVTGTSGANEILEQGADVLKLLTVMRGLGQHLTLSSFISAFYDLALFEDRLMVEWLLQEHDGEDARYRLANVLLQSQVQHRFDIILIDVPPRLTAGTINALCTSTHVLVPTIFNPIAAEPVPNFLDSATRLLHQLNPAAKFVGVVETMAPPDNVGQAARALGRSTIEGALRRHPGISILNAKIPRRVPIAEGGIAYLVDANARAIFDELGDEISARIGL